MAKNLEQRVEALEKRNEELEKQLKVLHGKSAIKLGKKLGVGDTFEMAGLNWKILDITAKGYVCLADRLEASMQFDSSCNNWQASDLRNYLNTKFYNKLASAVGADNVIPFERNLLSLDGQTEYGTCEDKVSLISLDEYRKYRALIPNTGEYTWWTLTPDSTKCNNDSRFIRVVCSSGDFYYGSYYGSYGVRPFCIFSSSIFESEE